MSSRVRTEEGDMRKLGFRAAATAVLLCVSAFLLACPVGQLHIQIPDYFTSGVKGVQLYRVDGTSGELVDAGRIIFDGIETSASGELLEYRYVAPDGKGRVGPVFTDVVRNPAHPNGIEVTLTFINGRLPAGWFKVASYNLIGTSPASANQVFVAGGGAQG
jgi:hypothetical protein